MTLLSGSISTLQFILLLISKRSLEESTTEKLTSFTDRGFYTYKHWFVYRDHFFSDKVILNNALDLEKSASDMSLKSSLKYFDSITLYMTQLRGALGELRDDIL